MYSITYNVLGRLGEIALNAYHLWQYSIVRDCTRYLEQAVRELVEVEKAFGCAEEGVCDYYSYMHTDYVCLSLNFSDYRARVTDKKNLNKKFEEARNDLISKYKHGSKFHHSLESAYDEDVKV